AVLGHRVAVVGRRRRVVDAGDGDAHRGRGRGVVAVLDGVGVAVGAEVVGRRSGVRARDVAGYCAVVGLGHRGDRERLDLVGRAAAVVAYPTLFRSAVLGHRVAVVGRRRRVVDAGDGDAHRGRGRGVVAVFDGVGVAVGAEVVGGRRVGWGGRRGGERAGGGLGRGRERERLVLVGRAGRVVRPAGG